MIEENNDEHTIVNLLFNELSQFRNHFNDKLQLFLSKYDMIVFPERTLLLSNIEVASTTISFFAATLMHCQNDGPKFT